MIYPASDINTIKLLVLLLLFTLLEIFFTKNTQNCLNLLKGIFPLLVLTFIITLFFGGPMRSILLVLRISAGSLIFSLFIIFTNPSDLSKLLEKFYFPQKFAIIPSLSLSLIPRTLKDIEDTYNTLYLRGEIQGSFLNWIPKLMAISISSIIYRSNFIEDSLYIRGFNLKSRKRLGPNHRLSKKDGLRMFYWIISFIVIFYVFNLLKTFN